MAEIFGHNRTTQGQRGWNVVEPKINPDPAPQGRVNLDPFAFDDLIKQQGTKIKVFRTMLCPNVKDESVHNIDCTLCNGSAWLDVDPLCTVAVFQSQRSKTHFKEEGLHDSNTLQLTFPLGVEVSYFTLVQLIDFTDIFYQRLMRKPGTLVDVLKYSACRVNVLIDRAGVRYFQDVDFKLDGNGNVLWIATGATPADNQFYSIHYEAKLEFRAISAHHINRFARHTTPDRRIENLKFPETWIMSREFLVKRKDQDGNELKQGAYSQWDIVT